MKGTVLVVAEKPLLAKWIASILSKGRMFTPEVYNGPCPIHEYDGVFLGQAVTFKMTSTLGHVMGLDFAPRYNNWRTTDPEELFDAEIEKKEENPKMKMREHLASVADGCDYLVLWLDCDKEGENICYEVIDAVRGKLKSTEKDRIYRARFSAITPQDINQAMNSLKGPEENVSLSVDARKELDLRIGCAFTRFQTKYFKSKFGELGTSSISYGPCQTPALGFCVAVHDEIEKFESQTYWELQVTLSDGEREHNVTLEPKWDRGAVFDQEVAQVLVEHIKRFPEAVVVEIRSEESRKQKPFGLNTVELLRVASSQFGIGPKECMDIAERLYTGGYMSYVRTETTSYPASFELSSLLEYLAENAGRAEWAEAAKALEHRGVTVPREGYNAGDHPPITPVEPGSDDMDHLPVRSRNHARIYDYVCRHFLATISEDYKYKRTTAKFKIGDEIFTASAVTAIDAGFTEFIPWAAIDPGELAVLSLRTCQRLRILDVKLVEGKTQPPEYLTESDLITLMDEHRIGTDGSIPGHISKICERNYVKLTLARDQNNKPKRLLVPTALGKALVRVYQQVDPELVKPEMRAAVEKELDQIEEKTYHSVLGHVLEVYRDKFKHFVKSIGKMDESLAKVFQEQPPRADPLAYQNQRSSFLPSSFKHNTNTSPSSKESSDTSMVFHRRFCNDAFQMDSLTRNAGYRRDYFHGQGDTSDPVGRQIMNSAQGPGELRGVRPSGIGRGGNIGAEQGGGDFVGARSHGVIGSGGVGRGLPVAWRK